MSHGENRAARCAAHYLLYCFTASGQRLPPEILDAADDRMAIDLVRLQLHKRCELWLGNRLVFALPDMRTMLSELGARPACAADCSTL